jgi:hypothetical protein
MMIDLKEVGRWMMMTRGKNEALFEDGDSVAKIRREKKNGLAICYNIRSPWVFYSMFLHSYKTFRFLPPSLSHSLNTNPPTSTPTKLPRLQHRPQSLHRLNLRSPPLHLPLHIRNLFERRAQLDDPAPNHSRVYRRGLVNQLLGSRRAIESDDEMMSAVV